MIDPMVIRFTLFNLTPGGHGGDRRTAQLSEILDEVGITWIRIPDGMKKPCLRPGYIRRLLQTLYSIIYISFIIRKLPQPGRLLKTLWLISQFTGIREALKYGKQKVLLWEMTKSEYSFIMPLFKKQGFSIIAIPHNIESLVPEQRSGITNRISPLWLEEEIRILKKCDYIFTISSNDRELLIKKGIGCGYLPYFPPKPIHKTLLEIRAKRKQNNAVEGAIKKILMLGSVFNTPTREGVVEILEVFSRMHINSCELWIAGFGSGRFRGYDNGNNIKVLGELDDEKLFNVLSSCTYALVHQSSSSGALTRIIEFLIAGIPVISNREASRSYDNTEGIYVYDDLNLMFDLLKTDLPLPQLPDKPEEAYRYFKEKISCFV